MNLYAPIVNVNDQRYKILVFSWFYFSVIIIIGFLINVQVEGQYPHQYV